MRSCRNLFVEFSMSRSVFTEDWVQYRSEPQRTFAEGVVAGRSVDGVSAQVKRRFGSMKSNRLTAREVDMPTPGCRNRRHPSRPATALTL